MTSGSSMKPSLRVKIWSILLGVIGIPAILLVAYLCAAAWSFHRAESQANEACSLFVKDMDANSYVEQLKRHGFEPAPRPGNLAQSDYVDTNFKTIAISRYVCTIKLSNGRLVSSEVKLID
jgi:hypothetical protein